jgi:hypothetical protein
MEKGYFFTGFPGFICKCFGNLSFFNEGIKSIRKYLGVEKEALDYFTWMGNFDCTQAVTDLKDSGITCPDFKDGIKAMTEFYIKQKDNPNYQINIL